MSMLKRTRSDRWIAGVCGGFAKNMGMNSNLLRVLVIIASILTAVLPFLILYIIAWIAMPEDN